MSNVESANKLNWLKPAPGAQSLSARGPAKPASLSSSSSSDFASLLSPKKTSSENKSSLDSALESPARRERQPETSPAPKKEFAPTASRSKSATKPTRGPAAKPQETYVPTTAR